jgi:hypothetical protein
MKFCSEEEFQSDMVYYLGLKYDVCPLTLTVTCLFSDKL